MHDGSSGVVRFELGVGRRLLSDDFEEKSGVCFPSAELLRGGSGDFAKSGVLRTLFEKSGVRRISGDFSVSGVLGDLWKSNVSSGLLTVLRLFTRLFGLAVSGVLTRSFDSFARCEFFSVVFLANLEFDELLLSGNLGFLGTGGDFENLSTSTTIGGDFTALCFALSTFTDLEDLGVVNDFALSGVLTGVRIFGDKIVFGDFLGDVVFGRGVFANPPVDFGDIRVLDDLSEPEEEEGTNLRGSTLMEKSRARCLTFDETGFTSRRVGGGGETTSFIFGCGSPTSIQGSR